MRPKLLLCEPRFYRVAYVINPWMAGNVGRVDMAEAHQQWLGLRSVLAEHADIEQVEPDPAQPDMAFVANAGLVQGNAFVPARFRFRERQGEERAFRAWAARAGLRLVDLPPGITFEGEGDALLQPGEPLLWGGYGVRTSLQAYREIGETFDVEVVPLHLIDERFYHLDTCFCPLSDGRVLFYPEAFSRSSLDAIRARIPAERRLEVDAGDGLGFACNAVVLGRTLVLPHASAALREALTRWGIEAIVCPLSQFMLAGGAAKCLTLHLDHPPVDVAAQRASSDGSAPGDERTKSVDAGVSQRAIELRGHLLDSGLMNEVLDCITEGGGSFEISSLQAGLRHDQDSVARLDVVAPSAARLEILLGRLIQLGARVAEDEVDARLETVQEAGVAPTEFYSSTIFPTEVRLRGEWVRAEEQRMDAMLVVEGAESAVDAEGAAGAADARSSSRPGGDPRAAGAARGRVVCRLLRDLRPGDRVVCGVDGVRTHPSAAGAVSGASERFAFMTSGVSSERRVELEVERIAWEMRRLRERRGRVVVVAGPVVIHTGGAAHLAALVRGGYVQAVLGGNGLAVHDIEHALFGTSLGVDLRRNVGVHGGHRHHLQAINLVRQCGGIAGAVEQGLIKSGVFYECVKAGVPFALAGSIRDDGPLPETIMDLVRAQEEYARLVRSADMILMLSSMLHSIGVGNMTPAGVRLICVDISPAVVTKLADRGSVESTGIVTDVGLFLALLRAGLAEQGEG